MRSDDFYNTRKDNYMKLEYFVLLQRISLRNPYSWEADCFPSLDLYPLQFRTVRGDLNETYMIC